MKQRKMTWFYTAFRKKHPLMFSIISPAFLGRFLYFLYQWKEKWIPYNLLTYSLDDFITASLCTPQNFTSYSYFLTLNILSLKIKSWSKTYENVKDFLPEDWQKNLYKKKLKRWTLEGFLWKLQTTGSIERTQEVVGHGRLKMWCFYVR